MDEWPKEGVSSEWDDWRSYRYEHNCRSVGVVR